MSLCSHLSRLVLLYASASMKWDRQVDQGDALAEKELFATDQTKTYLSKLIHLNAVLSKWTKDGQPEC